MLGYPNTPGIGGNNGHILGVFHAALNVFGEHRNGEQVIQRPVEEPLNLGGMQVHTHEAVGAGGLIQVSNQAGRDRLTPPVLLVLASIRVEG